MCDESAKFTDILQPAVTPPMRGTPCGSFAGSSRAAGFLFFGDAMGFTKLDEGIIFSSIMSEDDAVFKVWAILLATCKQDGISPISSAFLETLTRKAEPEISRCLTVLSSPDPKSRSTNEDGRRIERVDGGISRVINN